MENFMMYGSIPTDGMMLVNRALFERMYTEYVDKQIRADIQTSEQQIKEGKCKPAEEVFARLRKKYGYKV